MTSGWRHVQPFSIFDAKRFCGKSSHAYSFEDRENIQIKTCKISRTTRSLSRIFRFLYILPSQNKKWFLKILPLNTRSFLTKKSNAIYMPHLSLVPLFLAKLWQKKKLLKIDDVKNSNSIFVIIDQVEQNLYHHWIPRDELHRVDTLFMHKYQLINLTFFDLTSTWN